MNNNMKGLELPVSAIIVIALALLVLVSVSAFFLIQGGGGMDRAKAQSIFAQKCLQYCDGKENTWQLVASLKENDAEFLKACEVIGVPWKTDKGDYPILCLKRCNCDTLVDKAQSDAQLACVSACYQNAGTLQQQNECVAGCMA